MEYSYYHLNKEADKHNVYILPSKFKDAGVGLFAAKGYDKNHYHIENLPTPLTSTILLFMPLGCGMGMTDLKQGTQIPYWGVLKVQQVASQDSIDPLKLPKHLKSSWDRVIVLGHQPIVSAKDIVVRSCFSGDF
jgi:hypothetical protein